MPLRTPRAAETHECWFRTSMQPQAGRVSYWFPNLGTSRFHRRLRHFVKWQKGVEERLRGQGHRKMVRRLGGTPQCLDRSQFETLDKAQCPCHVANLHVQSYRDSEVHRHALNLAESVVARRAQSENVHAVERLHSACRRISTHTSSSATSFSWIRAHCCGFRPSVHSAFFVFTITDSKVGYLFGVNALQLSSIDVTR